MKSIEKKIITFDLYGTLVDWRTSISSALNFISPNIVEIFYEQEYYVLNSMTQFKPYSQILIESLKNTLNNKKIEYIEDYGEMLVTMFSKSPFFPDSILGLKKLKRSGLKLGIISNTEKRLINITLAGMADVFDYVVTAEDTGYYKPKKEAFISALNIMKLSKNDIVHVSSYPQYDLNTTKELGISGLHLNRYGFDWKPDIKSLSDIIV